MFCFSYRLRLTDTAAKLQAVKDKARQANDTAKDVLAQIKEKTGNTSGGFGYAATLSWVYSLIVLVIIGATFLLFKERKSKVKHVIW